LINLKKYGKNWLQFKEPQAPSTQSTEKLSDEKLSGPSSDNPSLTNDQDNIEVLPRLNNENKSYFAMLFLNHQHTGQQLMAEVMFLTKLLVKTNLQR